MPILLFLLGGAQGNERGFGTMWGALFSMPAALGACTLLAVGGMFVRAQRDYGRLAGFIMMAVGLSLSSAGLAVWVWFFRWGGGFF